jgi:hypothetical protein
MKSGMIPPSLNYLPTKTRRRRRWWPWFLGILLTALTLLALAAIPSIPVRQVESSIDPVTGTMTWKTIPLLGTPTTRVDVSPLEIRLKASGIPWTPSSKGLHIIDRNIFDRALCYGCSIAPPIHGLPHGLLKEFEATSTDAELREFVRIMETGTIPEQKAAVEAAAKKTFDALAASSPP